MPTVGKAGGTARARPPAPTFLSNPVVHSLSVTLSNHTILSTPPYNYPCPKDHLLTLGVMPMEWSTWARTLVT
jgi:hypothetical protein